MRKGGPFVLHVVERVWGKRGERKGSIDYDAAERGGGGSKRKFLGR